MNIRLRAKLPSLGSETFILSALIALSLGCCSGCGTSEPSNADSVDTTAASASATRNENSAALDDRRLAALWKQRTEEGPGSDFHVGPGDVLNVSVPAIEQLKEVKVRVSASRTITLPMVGVIDVGGMTEQQVRDEISHRLEKYMYHPEVTVFGVDYQSREVAVVGNVQKPGLYTLASRSQTILQMVSEAGMTAGAAQTLILIPHGLDRQGEVGRLLATNSSTTAVKAAGSNQSDREGAAEPDHSQATAPLPANTSNPAVASFGASTTSDAYIIDLGGKEAQNYVDLPARPGDVVIIPESGSVMVQGWVANAGAYRISPGMTVLSTVAAAGGEMFSTSASVFRTASNGEKIVMPVDLSRARKGEEPDPKVESGDVVVVNRSAIGALPYAGYFIINKFSTGIPIMW